MPTVIDAIATPPYLAGVADDIIRDTIMREVARRKLTAYGLWRLVEENVGRTTIHEFMHGRMKNGKLERVALTTDTATYLIKALGITKLTNK